ncbi:MAG: metal-dependent transcriptional regulator [Candidatus Methanomethylicota archaeon]|jgi:DtxR family Mn-dependent transcriptional regulator|uniref:Metal-dependent transcriptional regulator n=1 Tax=Thermoproteota archaeon TaxID=2056631 RepID=A0A520KEF1_9CREN|nr:MAG: metal-dependent transcriptional regulator [Candidatus Verstraetearchaeota archaeon]TDA37866.1 MAG: metal-dependent transcriptional regulator [Candidatus Verstraetearchaeota archaeon]
MSVEEITPVIEEYLECIYRLEEKYGVARTKDIVNVMKVVPGTVTNTIKLLERKGFIIHQPYHGVKLTDKGRKLAIEVIRKHRLSECLLTDILNIEWEKAHEIACRLEHSLTDEIIKSLERILNNPKKCPHGNPIPTKCGGIVEEESIPLTELDIGSQGIIIKIVEEHSDVLQYLSKLGIIPGNIIKVLEKNSINESITLMIKESCHVISNRIASIIYVKKLC